MRWAACAASALRCFVRIYPQPSDQLRQVLRRHGFLCSNELRLSRKQRYRLEIIQHVVLEREDRTVDDMSGPAAQAQRIAIACCAGDPTDANAA
jgi:hypothetical protein